MLAHASAIVDAVLLDVIKDDVERDRFVPEEFAFYLHIHNGFEGFIAHKIVILNGTFVFIRFVFDAHSPNRTRKK